MVAGFGRRRLTLGLGERDDEGERVVKMVSECLCCVWVKTGPNAPYINFFFFFIKLIIIIIRIIIIVVIIIILLRLSG